MLLGDNTLHIDGTTGDEEKSPEQLSEAVSEGIESVLSGDAPATGEQEDESTSVAAGEKEAGEEKGAETLERTEGESDEDLAARQLEADTAADTERLAAATKVEDERRAELTEEQRLAEDAENTAADLKAEADKNAPDYSLPENLNEKSTERFNTLVTDNRELRETNDENTGILNGMRQVVTDSGLNNDEFLGAIDFAATCKKDPKKGIELMQGYMQEMAKNNGIEIEGVDVDLLADYPDLKEQVEDMALTRAGALEIAASRRVKAAGEKPAADTGGNRDEQVYNSSKETAVKDISTYLTDLSKTDIDWAAKSPLLVEAATYARDKLHPSQWMNHMRSEYSRITRIAAGMSGTKRTPTPLTGGSEQRGGKKEPQTVAEGINAVLS